MYYTELSKYPQLSSAYRGLHSASVALSRELAAHRELLDIAEQMISSIRNDALRLERALRTIATSKSAGAPARSVAIKALGRSI